MKSLWISIDVPGEVGERIKQLTEVGVRQDVEGFYVGVFRVEWGRV